MCRCQIRSASTSYVRSRCSRGVELCNGLEISYHSGMLPSGDRFDVQVTPEGKVVLTRPELADQPESVRLVKKDGYTVARGTRRITQEQVRRALEEFP